MPNSNRPATERLRAFTLVELLVVIGIIAVLVGILLPVIAGARERGRTVQCASNVRTILAANQIYRASFKRLLWVGRTGVPNHFSTDNQDSSIYIDSGTEAIRYGMLLQYGAVVRENFICPSSPADDSDFVAGILGISTAVPIGAVNGTYAMRGVAQGAPGKLVDFDSGHPTALLSDFEFRGQGQTLVLYPTLLCHKRGMNVGYADGHVQFVNGQFDSVYSRLGGDTFLPSFKKGTWTQFDEEMR